MYIYTNIIVTLDFLKPKGVWGGGGGGGGVTAHLLVIKREYVFKSHNLA